ncbi:ATP-binding cassette [Lithospermum erythrorhizon]|uniref:ATP-binding cassette n=1 Tax=Lithospermum erythrorhizon TaxID=34254 RepID=A0AAV3RX24_LITER
MMPPDQETTNTTSPAKYMAKKNMENLCSSRVDPSAGSSTSNNVMNPSCPSDNNNDQMQDQHHGTPAQFSVSRVSLHPITLKFEDVSYTITLQNNKTNRFFTSSTKPKPTRTILNGVSGVVKPGELLAMLGPSGSGKTTLLTALAGQLQGKLSGSITYNNHPFTSSIKRKTGFVAQDDVLYPHLTVLETLTYAALLRLPSKLTKEEKIEQVEMIILELGLTRCRNSIVGGPIIRGVSGGERKRVSIGIEMLVNPSLLLLDEPTSGLDSTTAQRIVATLRWLAKGGRSVVTTIHQPSSRLFRMFDKVMVLSDGCPIYSGSATSVMDYFASIGYVPGFNFVNPADFLLDLANGVAPDTKQDDQLEFTRPANLDDQNTLKQSLISSYRKNLYPSLKDEIHRTFQDRALGKNMSSSRGSEYQWTTSWWLQFTVLLSRGLKERKHESYSGLRIFQVMTVAIFAGLLWWHSDTNHIQDQVGLLFFFSIFWGFFPLFNATFAFPQERPMLTKERNSGMYRLSSYFFARTIGDLPMELILPSIFVTVTYWMGGLRPSIITFIQTLLIVLFNVLVSQSVGLALGAILRDVKQGITLSSVVMLVFLLAGGYYIQHIPEFIIWLKYISFSHYCYKLLIGVQYSMNEIYECGLGEKCRVFDYPAIKALEIENLAWDVIALLVMLVGYRVMAYVALRKG